MTDPVATSRFALTVGPVQYWWPRSALLRFYAQVADSAAETVVLGEMVCSRRHEMKLADWMALGRELQAAGKEVILASQALVMSESELRSVRDLVKQDEFAVEAGDMSAIQALVEARRGARDLLPFVLGPHLNIYNCEALAEHAAWGAGRWVAPVELSLDAMTCVNPRDNPVRAVSGDVIPTEIWAFGRLPLAFSARCFTARHHHLHKDSCAFRCLDDADGLLLSSSEGQPFLCLNGTQVQSAGVQVLIGEAQALRQAGVSRLRLSPCSQGFMEVLAQFDAVYNQGASADDALATLRAMRLPGTLVNGYVHRQPGMQFVLNRA
ncbi:MAG: U32 family peptidase [Betaproteobacteria bacterium]|nr:U32 family peptidase [Betaproteobacteria bacterium]MDE2123109.1 U32 family peptidase [Betaproteobacteria bacterium]MDE2185537.1 U32 family peptidase [Betaproteobacteria bacterium]MDE2323901.1 U32 family peptidase [Betaproteobacteria bacterium]